MIRTKRAYPIPSPSIPVTVFLIAEKLLSLRKTFQTFRLFLLTDLRKIKRNFISRLFCIINLLKVGRKNIFF